MIKIRKANCEDTLQLEKLFLETRQATFTWEPLEKFRIEDYKKSTEGETVFLAEDDGGKAIGFISVWTQDPPPFIHHLFVSPFNQRQGIGKLLIQSLFSWLPPPYRLKCVARNKDALAFYLNNNWIEVGQGISEDGDYFLLELNSVDACQNH